MSPRTMLLTLPDRYLLLCHDLNRRLREPGDTERPSTNGTTVKLSPSKTGATPGSQNPRYGWRHR